MPSNTVLGGVFMTDIDGNLSNSSFVSSENVCGIIFDTKIVGGMAKALTGAAAELFANGNVVEFSDIKEVKEAGLENVMYGLPYLHISQFFALAGTNQRLFVSFTDSSIDTNFECIERMQLVANGLIYQIGLWTGEPFATTTESGDYQIINNGILAKCQTQAETLGGKIGVTNYEGNSPVNILISAPVLDAAVCDYQRLPDLTNLDFPKVSVLLGQGSSDEIHDIQFRINTSGETPNYAIVGCVELTTQGNNLGWSDAAMFNLNKVLELTLNHGVCLLTGKQLGPDYGSLSTYKTFEELEAAYKKMILYFMDKMLVCCEAVEKAHIDVLPTPFLSAVIDDCMEKGMDVTAG